MDTLFDYSKLKDLIETTQQLDTKDNKNSNLNLDDEDDNDNYFDDFYE